MTSTSARAVIPILDKVFAMGTPEIPKTDNGPPWNGNEITQFACYLGFHHRKTTPYWPQANSEAERFMRVIGKTLKANAAVGKPQPWRQALQQILHNYRIIPHSTTGVAPATLLFGRDIHAKGPVASDTQPMKSEQDDLIARDFKKKEHMNSYVSQKYGTKARTLSMGDAVLVRQERRNKMTPVYDPKPYRVTAVKGSMITAPRSGHSVTRNSSFSKLITRTLFSTQPQDPGSSDDGDLHEGPSTHCTCSEPTGSCRPTATTTSQST